MQHVLTSLLLVKVMKEQGVATSRAMTSFWIAKHCPLAILGRKPWLSTWLATCGSICYIWARHKLDAIGSSTQCGKAEQSPQKNKGCCQGLQKPPPCFWKISGPSLFLLPHWVASVPGDSWSFKEGLSGRWQSSGYLGLHMSAASHADFWNPISNLISTTFFT